jgi:hypothetical protein
MGLIVTENSGTKFPPVPQGTHQAVCYGLVDIGTHHNPKFDKSSHECIIMWEIPDERITVKDNDVPRTISKKYTLSLGEKANLYKDLISWRGKTFSQQELEGFDLKNILGVNCMLQVIHNESGGKTYANISAILPLYKGIAAKPPESKIVYFSFGDSNTIPAEIPAWIKEFITSSAEWKALEEQGMGAVGSSDADFDPIDDIPF